MKNKLSRIMGFALVMILCFQVLLPVAIAVENEVQNNTVEENTTVENKVVENAVETEKTEPVNKVEKEVVPEEEPEEQLPEVEPEEDPMSTVKALSTEKARMCIDLPEMNTKVEEGMLYLRGWKMATVPNTSWNFYIDGKKVTVQIEPEYRQDVLDLVKGYGTAKENPIPGFTGRINLMTFSQGKHTLKAEVVTKEGRVLVSETVSFSFNMEEKVRTCIDLPNFETRVENGSLFVKGWVMTTVPDTIRNFYIDGQKITINLESQEREDVLELVKGYGTIATNPDPGFTAIVNVVKYAAGEHTFKMEITTKEGRVLTTEETKFYREKFEEKARMCIDKPERNTKVEEGMLYLRGWKMANVPNTNWNFYVDGQKVEVTLEPEHRQDVLDLVKGYGTMMENPIPGFTAKINLMALTKGKHTLKAEVVTEEGTVLVSESVPFNFNMEEKVRTCIDLPTSATRAEDGKLFVRGWVMTTVPDTKRNFYIDGQKIEINLEPQEREDVLRLVKGYGTIITNPDPGFIATVDVHKYATGNHTFKMEITTKEGRVLATEETKFYIQKMQEKARMYIDNPLESEKIEKTTLSFNGWVMANVPGVTLEAYIDGQKANVSFQREVRQDVLDLVKGYGTVIENPQPGFRGNIDLSAYNNGNHTLTIKAISDENKVIVDYSVRFKLEKPGPKARACIDLPDSETVVDEGKLFIKGWVMANVADTKIKIYVDGNEKTANLQRELRQDVLDLVKGYGDKSTNPQPGFTTQIDVSELSHGQHTLKIDILTKEGTKIIEEQAKFFVDRSVGVKYQGYLAGKWQDAKKNGQTAGIITGKMEQIQVSFLGDIPQDAHIQYQAHVADYGWENWKQDGQIAGVAGKQIEAISLRLQNANAYSVSYRVSVKDIGWQKWASDGEMAGYTGKYKAIEAIEIKIVDRLPEIARISVDIPDFYAGKITVPKGKTQVIGWAMANSADAQIKAYIDGIEKEVKFTRSYRQDVIDLVKGYGGAELNPQPAFETYIDFGTYASDSIHTLEFKVISKITGKVLTTAKQQVLISRESNGIDVSQHNGFITWNAVKQSQDFVMIRAGFRGYGGGTINMDNRFIGNVQGAQAAGMKIGLYFFTQAINEEEAREEANWLADQASNYNITYPLVIDTEYSGSTTNGVPDYEGRADNLDRNTRTRVVRAFLETIKQRGFTPAVYASKSWLENDLDMSQLSGYDVWLAQYNSSPTYKGSYTMWQYTSQGEVWGMTGNVDLNKCYKNY